MRRVVSFLVLVVGLAVAVVASAAPRNPAACTSPLSCARACSVSNVAACERLVDGLLPQLLRRPSRDPSKFAWVLPELATHARRGLPAVCDAGNERSCVLLGQLEEIGLGGPADKPAARKRYTASCDRRNGAACFALGMTELQSDVPGALFMPTFERSCAAGFTLGCAQAGLGLTIGVGGALDEDAGVARMTEACEQKRDPLSCVLLGEAYEMGWLGNEMRGHAEAAFDRGCSLGDYVACAMAGGRTTDKAVALQYNEKACANGYGAMCEQLALKSTSTQSAVALQEQGCGHHDPDSCMWLATAHRDGSFGRSRDLAQARAYATRSCEAGGARSCVEAALLEVKDPARRDAAIASVVAMCDGGSATACRRLAVRLQYGRDVAPDLVRARALYQAECDLIGESPCADADTVSAEIAEANNRTGCERGDLDACRRFVATTEPDRKWLPLLETACQAEVRGACLLRDQSAFEETQDPARLTSSIDACDLGERPACDFVVSVTEDAAVKLAAQTILCRADDAASCEAVADAALEAEEPDPARALELYRKACRLDQEATACNVAGMLEAEIAQDRAATQQRNEETACERGDVAACTVVGHRTEDPGLAIVIWDRACAQRDPHACYHSGQLRAENDPERARADLTIACNGEGHDDACTALAALPAAEPTVAVASTSSSVDASSYASAPRTDSGERLSAGSLAEVRLGHYSFDMPGELMLPGTSGLQVSTAFAPALGRRVALFAPMSSIISIGGDGDLGVDTSAGVGLEVRGRRAALAASVVGGYGLLSSEAAAWAGVDSSLYVGGELRGRVRAGSLGLAGRATSLARGDLNELRLEGVLEYRGRDRTFGVGATFTDYGDRLSSTAFFLAVSR